MKKTERMNYQQLVDYTQDLLEQLDVTNCDVRKIKEKVNCIGKITNGMKNKLEYELNRGKLESIDFFEDKD